MKDKTALQMFCEWDENPSTHYERVRKFREDYLSLMFGVECKLPGDIQTTAEMADSLLYDLEHDLQRLVEPELFKNG